MKLGTHLKFLVVILLICSCADNSDLKKENKRLKKIENKYIKQTKELENSLVIPHDSLFNYFLPMTCGYDLLDVNEEVEFTTLLAWQKLPSNIKTEFKYDTTQAKMIDKEQKNLNREFTQSFKTKGEKKIYGEYIITLPNGKKKSFRWGRFVTVE